MGVELRRQRGTFRIGLAEWYFALELGHRHGWEPQGTRDQGSLTELDLCAGPHSGEFTWYNSYVRGQGRKVTAPDARSFAAALTKALPDVPDHDALAHKPGAYPIPIAMTVLLRVLRDESMPTPARFASGVEWMSGSRKQILRDLIDFSRQGGFRIFL